MSVRDAARVNPSDAIPMTEPVISDLRRATSWELALASEAITVLLATPGEFDQAAVLRQTLRRFDAARELLEELLARDPTASLALDARERGPLVLALLRGELHASREVQDAVRRDRRYHDQRRVSKRIRALEQTIATVLDAIGDGVDSELEDHQLARVPPVSVLPTDATRRSLKLLTPRQMDVLKCLSRGQRYGEIAASLRIAEETVRSHAKRVRQTLGVRTSRELKGIYIPRPHDDSDDDHAV